MGGLDYVGISKEHLSFRYIDNICIIHKIKSIIDIDRIYEPIFIEKKQLKYNYVKSYFNSKNFILEINKINWFDNYSVKETFINNSNNIIVDLYKFINLYKNIGLSEFRYNSILLLSNKINELELMKKFI